MKAPTKKSKTKTKRTGVRYDAKFKANALKLMKKRDCTLIELSKKLNISVSSLFYWSKAK